jgi:DNA modification methylase
MMKIHCRYDKLVPTASLKPYPKNRNGHSEEQIERLAKLLKYQGIRAPIVVATAPYDCIAKGHGTLSAIALNGWTEAPVVYQDFADEEQLYTFVQSDNAIAAWSELNIDEITADIPVLKIEDLDLLGIEEFEMPTEDDPEKDDAVPEARPTNIKLGDLFQLGDHRVLCGDATKKEDIERLMKSEKADMVFTDPPYGVDYDGGTTKHRKLKNDDDDAMYAVACNVGFEFSKPEAPLYMWHAGTMSAAAAAAAAGAGWVIRSHIIWNKSLAQYGALSAQYKQKHEPAFYCFKQGQTVNWCGPTNEITVWDCERARVNEFHPTQKPVALAERAIKNHNANLLFEPFMGSGSTLIACEKTNRRCFGLEIDESYCGVILDRWCKFTGQEAYRLNSDGTKTPWSELSTPA